MIFKNGGDPGRFMDAKIPDREDLKEKVAVVVGTRPGIIKMSPLIKTLESRNLEHFVIHAGQHYSENLDDAFFKDLQLSTPDYRLESVKQCEYHGEQTAEMLEGIEEALLKEQPRVILVCGDANFNLAGALAARKLGMDVGHVEAGLRSNDWTMPEEHNRVMIDHISDYLFSPTDEAEMNAREDNVTGDIHVTGNTIVDAVEEHIEIASKRSSILKELSLKSNGYFVVTFHREENVDDEDTFLNLVNVLDRMSTEFEAPIVFPAHPRTTKMMDIYNLRDRMEDIDNLELIEPLGYLDFLWLLSNTKMAVTDSGGIQEEACILEKPCVTLRENTERPETVEVGGNIIAGTNPDDVLEAIQTMENRTNSWKNPFGEGDASGQIIDVIGTLPGTRLE